MNKTTKERLKGQKLSILDSLRENKNGVTNIELSKISLRYTAHLSELRSSGYEINCIHENEDRGIFRYILISEPAEEKKQQRAIDAFFDIVTSYGNNLTIESLQEIFELYNFNVVRKWGANCVKE